MLTSNDEKELKVKEKVIDLDKRLKMTTQVYLSKDNNSKTVDAVIDALKHLQKSHKPEKYCFRFQPISS